jgi:hypothetical protein
MTAAEHRTLEKLFRAAARRAAIAGRMTERARTAQDQAERAYQNACDFSESIGAGRPDMGRKNRE